MIFFLNFSIFIDFSIFFEILKIFDFYQIFDFFCQIFRNFRNFQFLKNFGRFFQNFRFPTLQGQILVKKCQKGPKQAFLALFENLDFWVFTPIFGHFGGRFGKFDPKTLTNLKKVGVTHKTIFLKRPKRVSKVKSDISFMVDSSVTESRLSDLPKPLSYWLTING